MNINVMLVDDHAMVREGLRQLIEIDGDITVIAEAKDGVDCLEQLNTFKPDIILLDINMPNKNGLEVLKEIKERRIDSKVLLLTVHNEVEYLLKAFDYGADGYILKDSGFAELKKAIFSLASGQEYIQSCLIPALNSKLVSRNLDQDKLDQLTRREIEVLKKVSSGMSNKEIAINLCISERTVKNHIASIFKKIEVSDRTQAAVFAIRNNLITVH